MNRKKVYRTYLESPIGILCLEADDEALLSLHVAGSEAAVRYRESRQKRDMDTLEQIEQGEAERIVEQQESEILNLAEQELREYFAGERKEFTVPVFLQGTDFQLKVWNALQEIPYGEMCSYGEIARKIGNPKACRAVGGANNRNPVMIFIPCHRVVGADGSLVGFGAGLEVKQYLLELEKRIIEKNNQSQHLL